MVRSGRLLRTVSREGQSSPGVNVQAVTLPPTGQGSVPLVHGDVGAGLQQPMLVLLG